MPILADRPLHTREDLERFEAALTLEQRLPERSVYDVFASVAARQPERRALTLVMTGGADEAPRTVSYRELLGLIRRAANLFATLAGPRPGVAYMLPNLIETHAVLWGAETTGYAVPINFLLQPEPIIEMLEAAGVTALVALGPHPTLDIWQKALRIRERLPRLKLLRVAPPGTPIDDRVIDFHAALIAQPDDRLVFGAPGCDDDLAAMFHTGGTTGTPKLVMHTHRGQLAAAFGGAVLANFVPSDTLTATLPLFHVGGTIFCGLSVFMAGAHLLVMSPGGMRNPAMVSGFWRITQHHRATLVGAVPTSVGAVLDVPLDGADIGTVRAGFCGGSPLPPVVGRRFREVTGRDLHEVYGMTESSLISIDPFGSEGGTGSVGWSLPYTEVTVRRLTPEGFGEACAPEEIGVVTVRGPTVSPGYRNPAHNVGVFERGLLNTGDLGYTDVNGRLHIAGRVKDVIIRSGHNIDPLMIENAMAAHPAVAVAAAIGLPDVYAGEVPACYAPRSLCPGACSSWPEVRSGYLSGGRRRQDSARLL
jgi:fatty-acyl-CoA synthase